MKQRAALGCVPAWGSGDVGRGSQHLLLCHVVELQLHDTLSYHESRYAGSQYRRGRDGVPVATPEHVDRVRRRGWPPIGSEEA